MSYPDARYLGEGGEISASHRPADRAPDLMLGSTAVHYLATGASTGGEFGLHRWDAQPHSPGAGAHFHRTISESFFVLSGTVRLFNGEQWIDARAGDFLYIPPGGIHAFANESGEPASMLLLFAPGAEREPYFEVLAEVIGGRRQFSPVEWTEFSLRHDSYFLPPP
jgi:quercetin dioxygenase-like cupin family protein